MVAKAHDNDYVDVTTCVRPGVEDIVKNTTKQGSPRGRLVRYVNGIKGVLVFGNDNSFVHVSNSVFE
jgi:hypothetical protein